MRKNYNIRYVDPRFKNFVRRNHKLNTPLIVKILLYATLLILPILLGGAAFAFADDGAELNENIQSILDGIDLSKLQAYLDKYGNEYIFSFGNSAREIVNFLINGNLNMNYGDYVKGVLSALFSGVGELVPAFSQVIAITILSALCKDAEGGVISKTTSKAIHLACSATIMLILSSMLVGIVSSTISSVSNIKRQIEIITPILITLTILTGGGEAGAIYQPCAVFLGEGAIYLVNSVIIPVTVTVIVLNLMSRLNPDISFTGVSDLLKSAMKWIIGITVAVFGLFLSVQSSSSSLFNGIFFKVTKYLVGNSVPIVGNFLSAGVDMVVLSGAVVKSALGMTGIVLLIGEIIPSVVALIAFSLMLKITSAICQPLGEEQMFKTFTTLSKDVEYFIAGILTVAFLYLVMTMIIINSTYAFI